MLVDELVRARARRPHRDDRHRRAVPRDARDLAAFEERFGVRIDVEDATGPWTGPEHCCGAAKVAALERALSGADAWITGIRREQSPTRANAQPVECDEKRSMWKYNPLVGLDREGPLAAHPRARPALPPAARPGLRVDRLRAVHAARRRPRGPLGGHRQDGVRAARLMDPLVILFGFGVGILIGADRDRRRLADDAAADPRRRRAAGRRDRHRPRLRRDHEDASAAGATCARARSTSACRSGSRSAACRARSPACCSTARSAYGDGFDATVLLVARRRRPADRRDRRARRGRCSCRTPRERDGGRADAPARRRGAVGDRRRPRLRARLTSVGSGALIGLALILRLPAHAAPRRRHRRLPRRDPALGRRRSRTSPAATSTSP